MGTLKLEVHESLTTQEVVTAVRDYLVTSGRIVRFQTGNIKTTITELMSAQSAAEIHKRSL